MPETISRGARIRYDDLGQGEPALLFLPGWCTDRSFFRPLVERLQARRRVLALDLRGHGDSERSPEDFGNAELIEDARAVVESAGVRQVIPVALSHAGWVAIGMRRMLGERIPKTALIEWIISDPPAPFLDALRGLQDPGRWSQVRDQLFDLWLNGTNNQEVESLVRTRMGSYGPEMWARAGREIGAAYAAEGSPLRALSELVPSMATLHLYSQPQDDGYLQAQQTFAADHPWFSVHRLNARTHFPMFEVPDELSNALEEFAMHPAMREPVLAGRGGTAPAR